MGEVPSPPEDKRAHERQGDPDEELDLRLTHELKGTEALIRVSDKVTSLCLTS
jgi:hypothetical protein